jgi:hypothetical protein
MPVFHPIVTGKIDLCDHSQRKIDLPGSNRHIEAELQQQQEGNLQEICNKQKAKTRKEPVTQRYGKQNTHS